MESIGGRAAIIVNNEEGEVDRILMVDDGTGSDVTIPGVLIRKEDGDIIKKFIKDNNGTDLIKQIVLDISFEMV